MLGTMLCNIFNNDLEGRLACTIIEFADDVKLGRNPFQGSTTIQSGLDSQEEEDYRNFMKLNKDECNVLGLGEKDPLQWYRHCPVREELCWKEPGHVC